MVDESGSFPEVCKKSMQAMAADMQGGIRPDFWKIYSLTQLQAFTPKQLEGCGRLTQPVAIRRGDDYYQPITWDDAMSRISGKLKNSPADETFWYFSGRSSNEAGFLLQLFARVYGTNNVTSCSYYCHKATSQGLSNTLGTGTATVVLDDLEHTRLVMSIGGNPPSNHPRLMTHLKKLRRRGGECIVINPVVETGLVNFKVPSDPTSLLFGTKIASLYVQPHIGGDLALLTGVAKEVLEMGAEDRAFLERHCDGWTEWEQHLQSLSWEEIVARSGVDKETIHEIAERYARAESAIFSWTMGITHHLHGTKNVEAIANLALLRGMVGRPHAGLLPIRGHSNVQGIGSVGAKPQLPEDVINALNREYGLSLPTSPGKDTMACMEAAEQRNLRFGFCLGGNLFGSNPDAQFASRALGQLEQIVYVNTTLNTGHAHGLADETIILPTLARDEEPQPTTQESMFNYVRLSDGGPRRHEGPRSEIEIIASLADRVLGSDGPLEWRSLEVTHNIRDMIARVTPGFEQMADIDRSREEFQIGGRTFHSPKFKTPNDRAQLRIHPLPDLPQMPGHLRLMTIRSEGQFNTVVYEEHDLYRGQDRRDVVMMHPDDLKTMGLQPNQRVDVSSQVGRMNGIVAREFEQIKPGNAMMYYPEANILVSRDVDPESRTPGFKLTLVKITPSENGTPVETAATTVTQHETGDDPIHNRQRSC